MKRISRHARRWVALAVWALGIVIFIASGWWNVAGARKDADNRLISEAGRIAAQIAGLMALPGARGEHGAARAIVRAAMDDERIYAIQIHMKQGVMEGLRRNYLWEPVPWDDEIAENCVQGMNPVRIGGQMEGRVDVWLSPRLSGEEVSLLERRERLRLILCVFLWTCAFAMLLWHWGEFRHLRNLLSGNARSGDVRENRAEEIVLGLGGGGETPVESREPAATPGLVDKSLAHEFQDKNPDAWLVTAGMFRQTFGRAPALIGRLYAEGEVAGLCHLGRMLEQAAPCVGARPLVRAARAMQVALNDPACKTRAIPVEACARVLEQTLDALGARGTGEAEKDEAVSGCKEPDACSEKQEN